MKNIISQISVVYLLIFLDDGFASPCASRDYGFGSFVCVCNSSYCDSLDAISNPPKGSAMLYESDKFSKRFFKSKLSFVSSLKSNETVIIVKKTKKYQKILGFGGAFTDAAGINIVSLPQRQQNDILSSYFSKYGLEYSMGRVPMASCDFSTHTYSYDDVDGDFNLTHFQLAEEDFKYKIPYIQIAQSLSQQPFLLFGSPWSSPAWMKTTGKMEGAGTLIGKPGEKYYKTWANYFVRFLQEYKKQNISFWGLTAENEPSAGYMKGYPFQALGFTAELQRDFIKLNLGPTLHNSGFGTDKIKLMILDDQRLFLPKWADTVLSDKNASQYVSGIAFHWYTDAIAPPSLLDVTHEKHPGMFILSTEACTGFEPGAKPKVMLGSWERGEQYAHDIIQDLLHWSVGWIDWNLALNMNGGPNWVKNFVDSPIIVNNITGEFYKQPMYYVLAHFSKLLPRGSVHIDVDILDDRTLSGVKLLDVAAFQTPANNIVIIIVNRQNAIIPLVLQDEDIGFLNVSVSARSIQSYIW